jgi:ferrous iron transport protein B
MDKVMHRMGLHGKSFIPMIMGFGCNVPAVMATRTIENHKSRLVTMLVLPFMSCSARLPIYIVLIGAFFSHHASLVMLSLYAFGILTAVITARILSKFVMKGSDLPFVMELPPYRFPNTKSVLRHTWEKGRQYLQKMAGIILACSIIIWFLGYYPRPTTLDITNSDATELSEQELHTNSYLEEIGQSIAPVMAPLGFDWKMSVGILTGIGAKELIVSTLGVMFAGDIDTEVEETRLQHTLQQAMTPQAAMAYMVFILLYFPCIATIIAIKNESGKWKWALFAIGYTTLLAYLCSLLVYRIGLLFA